MKRNSGLNEEEAKDFVIKANKKKGDEILISSEDEEIVPAEILPGNVLDNLSSEGDAGDIERDILLTASQREYTHKKANETHGGFFNRMM